MANKIAHKVHVVHTMAHVHVYTNLADARHGVQHVDSEHGIRDMPQKTMTTSLNVHTFIVCNFTKTLVDMFQG